MSYFCYLIKTENKTYIGITNKLSIRLKKHNGLIKGGSKSTRGALNWKYYIIIGNFINRSTASRFEWYWKHQKNKNNKWIKTKSGLLNKTKRLIELLIMKEWSTLGLINQHDINNSKNQM